MQLVLTNRSPFCLGSIVRTTREIAPRSSFFVPSDMLCSMGREAGGGGCGGRVIQVVARSCNFLAYRCMGCAAGAFIARPRNCVHGKSSLTRRGGHVTRLDAPVYILKIKKTGCSLILIFLSRLFCMRGHHCVDAAGFTP